MHMSKWANYKHAVELSQYLAWAYFMKKLSSSCWHESIQ